MPSAGPYAWRYTPEGLKRWIPQLIRTGQIKKFYICKPWRHLREEVLEDHNHECQMCKRAGSFSPATCVHHVEELRVKPERALDKTNLVALCDECHYKIHHTRAGRWNDERW